MQVKQTIQSQYYALLEMLRQAIEKCPDELWGDPDDSNPFWHTVFHALFYAHFYLHPRAEDFVPWEKHREEYRSLSGEEAKKAVPYSKEEMLAYLALCHDQRVVAWGIIREDRLPQGDDLLQVLAPDGPDAQGLSRHFPSVG